MTPKDAYRSWCAAQPELPVFMQDWWMDAVCTGKDWTAVDLPSGQMMPCLVRKRIGMRYVVMPQQTQIGGLLYAADSPEVVAASIEAQRWDYYYQKYPIGQDWVLGLRAWGFKVKEMITYRIADLSSEEAVVRRFSQNKRRQLKKAATLRVDYSLDPDTFYAFHAANLRARGRTIAYDKPLWDALYRATAAHQAGQIVALRDADERLVAAAFLAYDAHTCYYLIPTHDDTNANGAGARLVLESIRFAATHSQVFDFEGSMIPGVANHYRQFGSEPTVYYSVEKIYNPLFRLLLWGNRLLNRKKT